MKQKLMRPPPMGLEAETMAYLAAMTAQPGPSRQYVINNLVLSLKAGGVWSKLDWLCLHAAHNAQAGRINLVDPTEIATTTVSPTFTADRHYQGNAVDQILDSGWNPTIGTHQLAQNSSHMGIYCITDVGGTASFDIGGVNGATGGASIRSRAVGTADIRTRLTSSGVFDTLLPAATAVGHTCVTRTTSTNIDLYKDAAFVATGAVASLAPANTTFGICGLMAASVPAGYGAAPLSVTHWGAGLTAGEIASLRTAIETYLTAVGAL